MGVGAFGFVDWRLESPSLISPHFLEFPFPKPISALEPSFLEAHRIHGLLFLGWLGAITLEWPELIERTGIGGAGSNGISFKSNAFQTLGFDGTSRGTLFSPRSYEVGLRGTWGG